MICTLLTYNLICLFFFFQAKDRIRDRDVTGFHTCALPICTNIQDAMKCSTAVIEGLRKMKKSLFILSTHLYEIGEGLKQYPNIQFRYFETSMENDQLEFSYQLKEGISNDRIGYLILKREGVTKILDNL